MFRIKMVALLVSGLTFILSVVMLVNFDPLIAEFQFIEKEKKFGLSRSFPYHRGLTVFLCSLFSFGFSDAICISVAGIRILCG